MMNIVDPPSQLVHSINIYVGGYLIVRSPLVSLGREVMFVDVGRRIADARAVQNHMKAISFIRHLRRTNYGEGMCVANVYGTKYMVLAQDNILATTPLQENEEINTVKSWLRGITEHVSTIPTEISRLEKFVQKFR